MFYNNALRIFLIVCFFFTSVFSTSYGLTESVDIFGQINSADLILNDIWIEPENPKRGEAVTVHGSVYNAGVVPSEEVSNVVTIGYIVNGELLEIAVLENVLPGLKNGVEISSGPIFDAYLGNPIITVIINYHDTLSHIRDNPGNNIVQKMFQIGTDVQFITDSKIYQQYNEKTGNQEISIVGEVTDIFQEETRNQEIIIDIEGHKKITTITDSMGVFSFEIDIPYKDKMVKVTSHMEQTLLPTSQLIYPLKLNHDQSAIVLENISASKDNIFNYSTLTIVLFQDTYENLFKKISLNELEPEKIESLFPVIVPGNHEYIAEIYIEGKILDAFSMNIENGEIIKKEIEISESAQLQFRITNEFGEPQKNVQVDNWVYSTKSNVEGFYRLDRSSSNN